MTVTEGVAMSVGLSNRNSAADLGGMLLSLGCAAHCLAAPVLVAVIPFTVVGWLWNPLVHQLVAVLTVGCVFAAISPGYRRHGRPEIPFLATLGCGLIAIASLVPCAGLCSGAECSTPELMPLAGWGVAWWTPLGALLLVATHLANFCLSRERVACCDGYCP